MRESKPRKCKNRVSLDEPESKNENFSKKPNLKKLKEVDLDAKDDDIETEQNSNYFDHESSDDDFKVAKKTIVKKKELKVEEKNQKTKTNQKTSKPTKKTAKKDLKKAKNDNDDESSDSEDDWEEVKVQNEEDVDELLAKMSKEPIEITIDSKKKRNKKELDLGELLMKSYLKFQKTMQIEIHKTHLLCWINHGLYLNNICNDDLIRGSTLSQLPNELLDLQYKKLNLKTLKKAISQVKMILINKNDDKTVNKYITYDVLLNSIKSLKCNNSLELNLMMLIVLRLIGFKSRLSIAFEVLPLKEDGKKSASRETKKKNNDKTDESDESEEEEIELDSESDGESIKKSKNSPAKQNFILLINYNR
jgi:xeroderma pigmentosum group C-complementing protein